MTEAFSMARRFLDDVITSPINICLVALICYFSYRLLKRESITKASTKSLNKTLEKMPNQDFTLENLREYDGIKSNGRILMGVLGRVFDVSNASDFYGPGGPYSVFAGRDASRALATFSVDSSQFKDTHDDLSDLKPSQMSSVKEWEMQFLEKYPVVGKLLKPGEEPTNYNDTDETNTNSNNSSACDEVTSSKKEL